MTNQEKRGALDTLVIAPSENRSFDSLPLAQDDKYQLSVVSCQLSVVGCQLSVVGCQLSVKADPSLRS
jgi:hypothetical protein